MKKKICFVTTGDIKNIATAKRALGMANPLQALGWEVHILLEDAAENVSKFHKAQIPSDWTMEVRPGVKAGHAHNNAPGNEDPGIKKDT